MWWHAWQVSLAIILVNHTQTLAILGNMQFSWPPWLKQLLGFLTLDFLHLPAVSCLLRGRNGEQASTEADGFWVYTLVVCTTALNVCRFTGRYIRMMQVCLLGKEGRRVWVLSFEALQNGNLV